MGKQKLSSIRLTTSKAHKAIFRLTPDVLEGTFDSSGFPAEEALLSASI